MVWYTWHQRFVVYDVVHAVYDVMVHAVYDVMVHAVYDVMVYAVYDVVVHAVYIFCYVCEVSGLPSDIFCINYKYWIVEKTTKTF